MKDIKKEIDNIVKWLQNQVSISKTKGLVVGISGGIDSAVVSFLIKKAFPNDSLGVILPIKSNPLDREDAIKVAKACDLNFLDIDLTDVQNSVLNNCIDSLKEKNLYNESNFRISDANLRARLRMSTIYTIANNLNYLVVGTDNAAEVYTGYFTKYGDGGVDILPIANLLKREVFDMARELNVPESVIQRPPSAGLWEGQTDEIEMGTTYEKIDDHLIGKSIPKEDESIIIALHKRSEHKRKMPSKPE